jgi:hypothetical protein
MKTTLWDRDELRRARPLLDRVRADACVALRQMDAAVLRARWAEAAFERARPGEAGARWIDRVRAGEDLAAALAAVERAAAEAAALNGRLAFEAGGDLRLAGLDESGRPVFWTPEGEAEAILAEPAVQAA